MYTACTDSCTDRPDVQVSTAQIYRQTNGFFSGSVHNWLYNQAGELSAYLSTCLAILSTMCMMGVIARNMANLLEEITGANVHEALIDIFGLTPFLDSYPDLMAAALVSLPGVIFAIGIKVIDFRESLYLKHSPVLYQFKMSFSLLNFSVNPFNSKTSADAQ